ncbi:MULTISPECIES: hypothetical protein [unclassified Listeria]|uniref:hypothetical protein n=1 Tax=unclassified Listeria TaxID=2642072 RepID=UPI000B5924B8|nr:MULTISPECIES: hypothetical protein [unclassified Listeria]
MVGVSILMLVLGFIGLVVGIILIINKKTRKAGVITTISSIACGIVFSIVFVVGIVNEGAKAVNEAASTNSTSTNSSDDSADTSLEDESTEEYTDTESEEGSRANPTPLNSTLSLSGSMMDVDTYDNFKANMDITITETIRGNEAAQIIQAENQFNEPAPDGKEYILNKVKVKAYGIASPENKFMINDMEFEYLSSTGTLYDGESVVIPNELSATLYNEGTAEGYIQGTINKNDAAPLIKYENFYFSTK